MQGPGGHSPDPFQDPGASGPEVEKRCNTSRYSQGVVCFLDAVPATPCWGAVRPRGWAVSDEVTHQGRQVGKAGKNKKWERKQLTRKIQASL